MYSMLLASIALVGQISASPEVQRAGSTEARCEQCGADASALARTITRLQSDDSHFARFRAVIALRRYQIRCHPEIVTVLITALRHDLDDGVRAEAAISLARLGANSPEVIDALRDAAAHDQLSVRLRAQWGLRELAWRGRR